MKNFLKKIFRKHLRNNNFSSETPLSNWQKDKGDYTHRINYKLDKDSVVFDLGGYEGWFAARIYCKYLSKVFVFEPHPAYAAEISKRFEFNSDVKVFDAGLSNENTIAYLSEDLHSSTMFSLSESKLEIKLQKASEFITAHKIDRIDLVKINIEGGEYDLLDHLIETGLVNKIKNIQVQFHDFVPNAEARMENIQKQLELSHRLTYQYRFIWENWELK